MEFPKTIPLKSYENVKYPLKTSPAGVILHVEFENELLYVSKVFVL